MGGAGRGGGGWWVFAALVRAGDTRAFAAAYRPALQAKVRSRESDRLDPARPGVFHLVRPGGVGRAVQAARFRDQFRAAHLLYRRGDVPPAVENRRARRARERGRVLSRVRSRARRAPPGRRPGFLTVEIIAGLMNGFAVALEPANLFWCFVGVLLGTVVGILPGLGPPATIAMLLPLTFNMNPAGAIIMLAGIYYRAKYGGSPTPILINGPGESASVVTCIDGYQMAKKGRAGAALGIAAIA